MSQLMSDILKYQLCQNFYHIVNLNIRYPLNHIDVISWKRHTIALARFRCGNHQLSIERHRGILDRNQRLCPYCIQNNIAVIEDEYHFLRICPLYNHIRLKFTKLSAANTKFAHVHTYHEIIR